MDAKTAKQKTHENILKSMEPIYQMIDNAVSRREYRLHISKHECGEQQQKVLIKDGYEITPNMFNGNLTISWENDGPKTTTQW